MIDTETLMKILVNRNADVIIETREERYRIELAGITELPPSQTVIILRAPRED